MPSPEQVDALVRMGGWTLFVFAVMAAVIGLLKRLWVPGYLWLQERRDRLASDLQASANARALARLARQYGTLSKAVASIDEQLVVLLAEIRTLREEQRRARTSRRDHGGVDDA